jgi:LPS export ABC transporter protein LptC
MKKMLRLCAVLPLFVLLGACSFDYGAGALESNDLPDIVMNDVEYVRVRDGDPVVRFEAELAERYESSQRMELKNFAFEQFDNHGTDVNATGRAGSASVDLESGNIVMDDGVVLSVDSEDITIETAALAWQDHERYMSGAETEEVTITRSDGTGFLGRGFFSDVRSRTWSFSGGAEGTYVHEDDEGDDDSALSDTEEAGGEPAETGPPVTKPADETGAAEPAPAEWK